MGMIIQWLIGKSLFGLGDPLTETGARRVAHLGLFLVIAALIVGVVTCVRRDAVSDHQAKVERRAKPATDKAASERSADAIHNERQQQERRDVIQAQPDQPIAPTSRALACKRLRDAGRDPPACR